MDRMHLTPREHERLLLASAADLARRRLARGARLGATEAIALVCDEACELAWDDHPLEEVVRRAPQVVPREALLPGVAALVPLLQVEALFPHGTVLVHIDEPFGPAEEPGGAPGPGAVRVAERPIELAPQRERRTARLRNTGRLPIWVSSHVPLGGLNTALEVSISPDAPAAHYRLDLPAGTAVRVAAGEERELQVVALGETTSPGGSR
jgi:urease subunit gamma/beta